MTLFPGLGKESVRVTPFRATTDIRTRRSSLPLWVVMACYLPLWLLPTWGLAWRQRRKWAATSQEPWPISKVGHFLGRFPALFYVGMVPLGVLLGFWSESVINELKWERTPTWSVGEEVTVVDSALRFQRQKILGEEPGQAERYRWHGLWDEAGPEWKFSRVPNRLGTSARTLTRFPAQETSEELRQEEYVQVAVKRVAVPIWMMVCGYVVLWLLLVWWQVWRRRRSLEGVKTAEEDGDRDG